MIYENTKRSRRHAKKATREVVDYSYKFFVKCRNLPAKDIRMYYEQFSQGWNQICNNTNRNRKKAVQLHSDEFEQVTKLAYRKIFFSTRTKARRGMLRTVRIIEGNTVLYNVARFIWFSILKNIGK